jgi:hypothetical protein
MIYMLEYHEFLFELMPLMVRIDPCFLDALDGVPFLCVAMNTMKDLGIMTIAQQGPNDVITGACDTLGEGVIDGSERTTLAFREILMEEKGQLFFMFILLLFEFIATCCQLGLGLAKLGFEINVSKDGVVALLSEQFDHVEAREGSDKRGIVRRVERVWFQQKHFFGIATRRKVVDREVHEIILGRIGNWRLGSIERGGRVHRGFMQDSCSCERIVSNSWQPRRLSRANQI